jgi:UDP:flavonoid glycosyltransferase YjiC (YdhE family)
MRILLASTRGAGHIGPLVPFALACRRAGHDVVIAAPHSAWAHVARAKLKFAGVDEPPDAATDPIWARVREAGPAEQDRIVVTEIFAGAFARAAYPGMLALINRWRPDVVVRESCEYASLLAAEVVGVPVVVVEPFLAAPHDLDAIVREPLARLRRTVGVPARPADEHYLTLSPRSLDSGRPGAVRFRAPVSATPPLPAWWGRSRAPLVYVSFGSAAAGNGYFPDLYREAAHALGTLDARVLLTLGLEVDPADLGPVPANVHVERWVPQAQVMAEAAAMVGHGGSGSTLAAMAAGVPLGVLPLFADQPVNADRVAELGAGLRLERVTAEAVRELLDDPSYWLAAQQLQLEIADLPPISDVVAYLREVAAPDVLAA